MRNHYWAELWRICAAGAHMRELWRFLLGVSALLFQSRLDQEFVDWRGRAPCYPLTLAFRLNSTQQEFVV